MKQPAWRDVDSSTGYLTFHRIEGGELPEGHILTRRPNGTGELRFIVEREGLPIVGPREYEGLTLLLSADDLAVLQRDLAMPPFTG